MASVAPQKRLVGRARELALIDEAVTRAADGRGQLVVITGEAGVGKTRLAEEIVDLLRLRGLPVGWGRRWPGDSVPLLWPWPILLEQLCGVDVSAQLLGDLRVRDDGDPFTRARVTASHLRATIRSVPAVVVIDDAHVAGTGAVDLARQLVHGPEEVALLVVVTCRPCSAEDQPAATKVLTDLEHDGRQIRLGRFSLAETVEFLDLRGYGAIDVDLVGAIHRLTGGLASSLMHLETLSTAAGSADGTGDLDTAFLEFVSELMRHAEPQAAVVLARAAILGRSPSLHETAAVAGSPTTVVLTTLRDAERDGLVTIDDNGGGFSFTHELVHRAVTAHLDSVHELDAHACAAAVVGRAGDGDAEHAARYAHHALHAAPRSEEDAVLAVDACREAAVALVREAAPAQALALLERAAGVADQWGLVSSRSSLLVEWGDVTLQCGRLGDARSLFRRATTAAEADGNVVDLARAALGLGGIWLNEHRTLAERESVRALQRKALASLPEDESALRCRLTVRLAAESVYPDGPLEDLATAVDAARALGDPRVLAEALSLWHHAIFVPRHMRSRLAVAEELVTVASATRDGLLTLMGLCWRTVDLFHLADHRAERALAELHARADELDCAGLRYVARVLDVMLLVRGGLLDDAEAEAMACFELGIAVGDADAMGYLSGQLLAIRWLQAREVELLAPVEDLASSPSLVNDEFAFRATAAFLAARAGDPERARYWLHRVGIGQLASLSQSSTWLAGMFALVEAALIIGDAEVADEVGGLLEPYADLTIMPSLAVVDLGSVRRPIGLAALVAGNVDAAIDHLGVAVSANRRLGNRPLTAVTQAELGGLLGRRRRLGDREQAIDLLEEALSTALAAGMEIRAAAMEVDLAALRGMSAIVPAARRGVIGRRGNHWVVGLDELEAVVGDLLGMRYLAELVSRPGVDIAALRLAGGDDDVIAALDTAPQDVLDESTRAALLRRVEELRTDVADAGRKGDQRRRERAQVELDSLLEAVRGATGLRGRSRTFADPAERARTAVRKAIKRAIDELGATEPAIARHFRSSISTGVTCRYDPHSDVLISWIVERGI